MPSVNGASHKVVRTQRVPQLKETRYERTSAAFWTAFATLLCLCVIFVTLWCLATQKAEAKAEPRDEVIWEIEASDDVYTELKPTLVESPEEEISDQQESTVTLHTLLDTVESTSLTKKASAASAGLEGDLEPGNGLEGTGTSIASRRQKLRRTWLFQISIPMNKTQYIGFLNDMEIQLAAVFPDGRIEYLENLAGKPTAVTKNSATEQRFYTRWSNGNLLQFDRELFSAAGVDTSSAKLIQLFPNRLEARLNRLEAESAEQVETDARTWFKLERSGSGFEFNVSHQ